MQKTVSFVTLGCKVNQYDSQAMLEQFESRGYRAAHPGEMADVYVVNTCTVTGPGDKKSLQLIRRCARRNPGAALVVTGCLAQRMGDGLRSTGARLILGTQHRACGGPAGRSAGKGYAKRGGGRGGAHSL